jgi:integrase
MAAPMEKTRYPGIYKWGSRYVVVVRVGGKQIKRSARTLDEARRLKASMTTDRDRGEFQAQTRITVHEFAREWVERYQGTGRRGFRENTRTEYRRLLDAYALRFFSECKRLTETTPRDLAQFVAWLADEKAQGKRLSDSSIANAAVPLRAMFATAVREGLLRHNPATNLALPHRPKIEEEEDEEVRPLSRQQLADFLGLVNPRHRLLFEVLASCGLRISEAIGLRWRDLHLDGSTPHLKVRRAIVKKRVEPPKTRHAKRQVPLSPELVSKLRAYHAETEWPGGDDLVFCSLTGTPLDPNNLRARVLKPVAQEAGAPWAGFHTFPHTYASLMLAGGANVLQLSRARAPLARVHPHRVYAPPRRRARAGPGPRGRTGRGHAAHRAGRLRCDSIALGFLSSDRQRTQDTKLDAD